MKLNHFLKVSAFVLSAAMSMGSAQAAGTLIPAANRIDMVHDYARNIVYVTNGGSVLRYNVATNTFLSPIVLGGTLKGLDISPDGNTLVVADTTYDSINLWVHVINLLTLTSEKVTAPRGQSGYGGGTFAVAFASNGKALVSGQYLGSGWATLNKLDPVAKTLTNTPYNTRQDSMLSASADGKTIAIEESNISDGAWGSYDTTTDIYTKRTGYTDGTSWFNYEIATNPTGTQYAIPTYGGTFIYNAAFAKIGTIGTYAGQQPVGVAYHPVEPLVYFPFVQTSEVRVFNTTYLTQVGTYDVGVIFNSNGNSAFVDGRTKLSLDGSLLMTSITSGVQVIQIYSPLAADTVNASTTKDTQKSIPLAGSIGNGGALTYSIKTLPSHGTVVLSGASVVYTPSAGYIGSDVFTYGVKYGRAIKSATVNVTVTAPINRAPVANSDYATVKDSKTTVSIPVLVNDTDADGDPLTITAVTQPAQGTAFISNNAISFRPSRAMTGSVSFTYTISDGRGGSSKASVFVSRR